MCIMYSIRTYVVFKVESLFKFDPKHLKLQNQSNSIFDSFSFVMRVFEGMTIVRLLRVLLVLGCLRVIMAVNFYWFFFD